MQTRMMSRLNPVAALVTIMAVDYALAAAWFILQLL